MCCWRRTIRRSNCASWRTCPATKGLLRAFAADGDVHRATAAEVFGVAPEAVSGDQRRSAKAINFGLIYGMSAFGLARQLGIERGAAQSYVERYFARYPGVKRYMDATRERAKRDGYRRNRVRPPPVPAGDQFAQPRAAAVRGAQRHQRADAGHRRRHHQARDDHRRSLVRRHQRRGAHDHAGARRTGARSGRADSSTRRAARSAR